MIPFLLFVCGIMTDVLWCWGARFAVERRPWAAAFNNGIYTTICLLTSLHIISQSDFAGLAAYVVGCGVGSYFSTKPT